MKPSAFKEFEDLPEQLQDRFNAAFRRLAENPFRPRPGLDVRPLAGRGPIWRLRVGPFRALYEVQGRRVVITEIGPRSSAYR